MAIELDASGDFVQLAGANESITLRRRNSAAETTISSARRFESSIVELEPTGGLVSSHDAVWQLPIDALDPGPGLGDVLVDGTGSCWTILKVELLAGNTRWRCTARDLRIAAGLNTWVEVQQATWQDVGSGLEIVGWRTTRPAVPASIQPLVSQVDTSSEPTSSQQSYRVLFGEQLKLDHSHRLVDPEGKTFEIVEFLQAQRIDTLPAATVSLVDPAT